MDHKSKMSDILRNSFTTIHCNKIASETVDAKIKTAYLVTKPIDLNTVSQHFFEKEENI